MECITFLFYYITLWEEKKNQTVNSDLRKKNHI